MRKKRVFLIVLDSVGIGAAPDADFYHDTGSHTLKTCYDSGALSLPTLQSLGLCNIEGCNHFENCPPVSHPLAMHGRMQEVSRGKDTTVGHWEISGLPCPVPFPTYPNGFPEEILKKLYQQTGYEFLCNAPYSGTAVIRDYGEEHIKTGKPILYTSADSVMQIAAHTDILSLNQLYALCESAREIMQGEHNVGRVIARPFHGSYPFTRTPDRHDFSAVPFGTTMLDLISQQGLDVISVGKIVDIFAGKGITESIRTKNNQEGMEQTHQLLQRDFHGLCVVNLVDFDMVYGHRNDVAGYTNALNQFDAWLKENLPLIRETDALLITADHGCDPGTESTDHSREYTPLLCYGAEIPCKNLGTRIGFYEIAKTVCHMLGVAENFSGSSLI